MGEGLTRGLAFKVCSLLLMLLVTIVCGRLSFFWGDISLPTVAEHICLDLMMCPDSSGDIQT